MSTPAVDAPIEVPFSRDGFVQELSARLGADLVTLSDEDWARVREEFCGRLENAADHLFRTIAEEVAEDETYDLGV